MGKSTDLDVFERLNFLYQAMHAITGSIPSNRQLTRFYGNTLMKIATKNIMKLDPSIKRNICKKCSSLLIPGVTCKVRIKGKRERHTVWTCTFCKSQKRFLCRPNYKLWCEQPEACVVNVKTQNDPPKAENPEPKEIAQE